MSQNFEQVTGRKWCNPFEKRTQRADLPSKTKWQDQLKVIINTVKSEVNNINDFLHQLKRHDVTISERGKQHNWTYHYKINDKDRRIRAFYQRKSKNGEITSTRGLGQAYTRQSLENYFKQKQSQAENDKTPLSIKSHHRKEVKKNEQTESGDQLEKVKELARESRQRIAERQREHQQLLTNIRRAQLDEDRKQRQVERKTRQTNREHRNQVRPTDTSRQARLKEIARRKLEAKQRRAKNNHEKDAGPDL